MARSKYQEKLFTFAQALALLQGRPAGGEKKVENNTYMRLNATSGTIDIILYRTCVVRITPRNTYVLHMDGFQTRTTIARIEQFSPARIATRKGTAVIFPDGDVRKEPVPFVEGMEVDAHGMILAPSKV